jgi:hypothetical protein
VYAPPPVHCYQFGTGGLGVHSEFLALVRARTRPQRGVGVGELGRTSLDDNSRARESVPGSTKAEFQVPALQANRVDVGQYPRILFSRMSRFTTCHMLQ